LNPFYFLILFHELVSVTKKVVKTYLISKI
jgi:hypothetical protein